MREGLKKHYPSASKTGWLVYLYNYEEGSTPYGAYTVPTGNLSGTDIVQSVFGVSSNGNKSFSLPKPFEGTGAPNGTKTKNGLLDPDSGYYWQDVVEGLWDRGTLEEVAEEPDKYYLVLEVVTCHSINPGQSQGQVYTATVHNWAEIDMGAGKPAKGDGKTGWCDNAVAPDAGYLHTEWEGLCNTSSNDVVILV